MYPLLTNDRNLTRAQVLEASPPSRSALYPELGFVSDPPRSRSCDSSASPSITLLRDARVVQVFPAQLTDLQLQVLELLGVPAQAFGG